MQVAAQRFDGIVGPTPTPGSSEYINPGVPSFVNAPTTSLLTGERLELDRTDSSCFKARVENEIRTLGAAHGMPPFAFVEAGFVFTSETPITNQGEMGAIEGDSCVPFRSENVTNENTLLESNVPESSPPPAPCAQQGASCHSEFASYVAGTGQAATLDMNTAREFAMQEISHGYPRAAGDGCPNGGAIGQAENFPCITINGDPAVDREVVVTSQMNVPLSLLGGSTIPMSYTARRTFEREFAK